MAENLLSRIFGGGSIYETLQQHDDSEHSAGGYRDDSTSTYAPSAQSHYGMSFHPFAAQSAYPSSRPSQHRGEGAHDRVMGSMLHPGHSSRDALEGAVPESLLYEHPQERGPAGRSPLDILPPRPDETGPPARWEDEQAALQRQRDLLARKSLLNPRDWAMWRWANVHTNLDNFLQQVYGYYDGNGIWSILLSRTLSVLTLAFVTGFSTYLGACIDYSKVRGSHSLSEIKVDKCMAKLSGTSVTVLALLTMFWCFKIAQYLADVKSLWDMHKIYKHLLDIDEEDMQTISWNEVVNRLVALRDQNPTTSTSVRRQEQNTERMDAHDIANRIMRKENYLVALFNKEILNLSAPLPFLSGRPLLTRTLEWNLSLCILAYVFDDNGQVRSAFVKDGAHRKQLIDGLRRRFLFAGIMNAIFAPFIIIYLLLLYFFKYFSEYHKNPGALGSRSYTPYAQWKFREFNEVQHLFQRRLHLSQLHADRYVSQFPNDKTMQTARFVSFVAGSFAAVLALASVIDPDLFLGFEITHDRTVLFYISLFGTIMAVARSMVPDESLVFDPEASLREVVQHTHYTPPHWDGNFHSHAVKAEFCRLYDYRVIIFLREILSVLVTPAILWFSLPDCSERIIDFIREYTIHVDGIGFVCTFAVFDFSKHKAVLKQTTTRAKAEPDAVPPYKSSVDHKMEKSFLNFKASHPDWQPDPAGSAFLATVQRHQPGSELRSPNRRLGGGQYGGTAADSYTQHSTRLRRGGNITGHDGANASLRQPPSSVGGRFHVPDRPAMAGLGRPAARPVPGSLPEIIFEDTHGVGESFVDTTLRSPPILEQGERPYAADRPQQTRATQDTAHGDNVQSAGVLGLMHQFYQEAGSRTPL